MKKSKTVWLLSLATVCFSTAFSTHNSFALQQKRETILRLHGSNTIGAELGPDLAVAFMKKIGADTVKRIDLKPGTEATIEGFFTNGDITRVIEVRAHGSSTGFEGLKNKQCDIGMASRKIKDEEVEELASYGDMTSNACEHVLAMDGVAVIVNHANAAVSKMTFTQLANIFSGDIKDWSEIGWKDGLINIQARDENSGTNDTFQHVVLGKKKLAASATRWDSNEKLSDTVNADALAIGYCGLPYVKYNKALAISDSGPAIRPTVFTVATEDYPVSRRLYLYTPAIPENPYTQDFIAFALGREGQEMVKRHKFVDLTISAEEHHIEVSPGINQNYQVLYKYLTGVRGAKRLSTNFHFKGKSLELDSRATRDVERMVNFLADNGMKEVILAGFSDREENAVSNIEGRPIDNNYTESLESSCKRAQAVQEELRSRGVSVLNVLCVGSEMPIASNATELGRAKNRRVEIWVKSIK